jgi:anthranilate/para-aminobenzoate synthase component I
VLARVTVALRPDPLAIAAALSDRPGLFALVDGVGGGWVADGRWSFVGCEPEELSERLDPHDEATHEAVGDELAGVVPCWIGVVPYEARRSALERPTWVGEERRPLPPLHAIRWQRYSAVVAIDHRTGAVQAIAPRAVDARRLADLALRGPRSSPTAELTVQGAEPPERHVARVRAALELIVAGDVYQVNLARRLRLIGDRPLSPELAVGLARRLAGAAPAPFAGLIDAGVATVLSTSPELLVDARAGAAGARFGDLRTDPIKGTRPRRAGNARALDADPKERAELAMIVDVERNDLGRVAEVGSVTCSAPRVVRAGRVLHRVASVRARARPELSGEAVLVSIVPSGSVTGAPKVRAMEVIASLEPMRRGLYTGGLGLVAHDGSVRLAMAIRSAVFPAGSAEGEWLVGGGIVEASDPERELEETLWKSRQLAVLTGSGTM